MASEPMTVQEAIALIDAPPQPEDGDVLKFSAGKRYAAAWTVILAHARATTAGTASETMTVQDAIAVVSDMLTNHLRTPDDIAIETLLAHARATAGTGAGGGRVTVSDAMVEAAARQSVVDAVRNLVRAQDNLSKAEIDNAHGELSDDEYRKAADAYCAADDVFGATLTAALAASARGAA